MRYGTNTVHELSVETERALIGRTVYQIDFIKNIKLSRLCTNDVNRTAER